MTLPPNCLPPENAALSGDLLAVLGQPAAAPSDGQPAAPFAEILAVASPASVTCAPQIPVPVPPPVMYSSHCYTTLLQPATLEEPSVQIDESVAEVVASDPEPAREDEGTLLLAYQLLAGQWVPQPVVTPALHPIEQEATPVAEEDASIFPEAIQSTHCGAEAPEFFSQSDARRLTKVDRENSEVSPGAVAAALPADRVALPSTEKAGTLRVAETKSISPDGKVRVESAPDISAQPKPEFAAPTPSPHPASTSNSADTDVSASGAAITSATPPAPAPFRANPTPVKFAAPDREARAEIASGVNPPNATQEKKTLVADGKSVKTGDRQVGMSAANREYSMPYSAANKSSVPAVTALPQAVSNGGMQTGTTNPAAEISAAAAVQAPRLVKEIHAIADRISTIDRNTVEVRFDFNESDRLSVRVEYRDGTVHTTFRTDSDTLRTAVAREWASQAAAAEPRAYRVAEPVFTANIPASSDNLSQSDQDSGQSHGRAFEQQGSPGFSGHGHHSRSAGSSHGSSSAPSAPVRPETSHHLHTFA